MQRPNAGEISKKTASNDWKVQIISLMKEDLDWPCLYTKMAQTQSCQLSLHTLKRKLTVNKYALSSDIIGQGIQSKVRNNSFSPMSSTDKDNSSYRSIFPPYYSKQPNDKCRYTSGCSASIIKHEGFISSNLSKKANVVWES